MRERREGVRCAHALSSEKLSLESRDPRLLLNEGACEILTVTLPFNC
jgi:hypothetical protein